MYVHTAYDGVDIYMYVCPGIRFFGGGGELGSNFRFLQ